MAGPNLNVSTTAVRQLSDDNSAGTILGQSSADLIGFYGLTQGVAQAASQGALRGAFGTVTVYTTTQSPSAVAANTAAEQAFTVTGVATGQLVKVIKPTTQAGLSVASARVSATNTVQVTFANDTSGSITPTASEGYIVIAIPAAMLYSSALTPASVPANTTAEQQFAVAGLPAGVAVEVNKPTAQTGLAILGARSVSAGILGITFANVTASPITPTAGETYLIYATPGAQIAPVAQTMSAVLNPASVAANTTAEQTFTVTGLISGQAVIVSKSSLTPGIGIGGARVSAANTLAINFANDTGVAIDPPPETYLIQVFPALPPAAGSSTAYNAALGSGAFGALVNLNLIAGP